MFEGEFDASVGVNPATIIVGITKISTDGRKARLLFDCLLVMQLSQVACLECIVARFCQIFDILEAFFEITIYVAVRSWLGR